MELNSRIYIAGRENLTGHAILKKLNDRGYRNIMGRDGKEIDLTSQEEVKSFFSENKPEYIFLTAGKSGGILANCKYPADLMMDNLTIICNIIRNGHLYNTKKILYLASSCTYPVKCPQPMKEEYLLTGSPEPTSEAYSVAKIAGIKLCQSYRKQYGSNFITAIPACIFGPYDDFSRENSHVIGALIGKMHEAKEKGLKKVEIWGTGKAKRDFIYSSDLADGCIFLMKEYNGKEPVNIGSKNGISIKELALEIKDITGFSGEIYFNREKPDGAPVKVLDSSRIRSLGWEPKTHFKKALKETYKWFMKEKG